MSEAVLKICPSCETPLATCGCLKKVQRYIVRACDDSGWHLKTCEYPDMGGKWIKASDVEALQHLAERAEASLRARDAEIEGLAQKWRGRAEGDRAGYEDQSAMRIEECVDELLALITKEQPK